MRTGDNFFRDTDMQREFWPSGFPLYDPRSSDEIARDIGRRENGFA